MSAEEKGSAMDRSIAVTGDPNADVLRGSVSIFPSCSRNLWLLNLSTLQIYMAADSHALSVQYVQCVRHRRRRKVWNLRRQTSRPMPLSLTSGQGSNAPSSNQIIP
jgi:hypothetical protein